ncbi:MAG: phage tail tape measure protein [Lachnospiraceae bacterium]|nr:phage tail tape measure protein [Lachnospiraceae bacterium]
MGRVISTALRFIDGFTRPSADAIRSLQKMGREFQKTGRQIQSAGKSISGIGNSVTKSVALPVAGIATAAVKTAADFESAMSEVGAISGASAKDMEKLTAKAKEMGAATSFSASESADAMKYMAMAGWKTRDMTEGIAGIMDLAASSGENLGKASDIVTDGLTAFNMKAKESSRFADVMAATSSNANTNVSMMGESFKYCASTAGAMGYKVEDVSVALGVMANAGIKGSTAGTTLKNVIANMSKPTDTQAALMKKLGISLTDGNGKTKSFAAVMDNLRSSFSGLSETQKASAAATLAGKQSMSGLLTIVNASGKDFNKLTKAINKSSGSAKEMADKMLDNLNGQITLLKSAIEGILITLGDKLLPHIKKVVTWVQKAADYINSLSSAQIDNIMKWAGIAAAIGPAVMLFGKVVTTVGTVTRTFGKVSTTIGNFGGILKTITSPAGIVISILAGIALAAVLIIKNWDKVQGFLKSVSKWFENTFKKAGTSVQDFKDKFSSIGTSIGNITEKTGKIFKKLGGIFGKEFSADIKTGTKQAGGALEKFATGTVGAFDGVFTAVDKGFKVFDALLSFFTGAFAGNWHNSAVKFKHSLYNIFPPDIASGLSKAFDKALPAVKTVVDGIKGAFWGLVQDIKVVFGDIKNIFKGFGTMFKGIFSGDAETALKGFKTAAGGILDTVRDIFKAKINAIKNFTVNAVKNFLPEGAVNAVATAFDIVAARWDNAVNIAKDCIDGFVQAVRPLLGNIKTVFKGLGQFVSGVFAGDWKKALNGLKNIAKGVFGGLVNIIKTPFKIIGSVVKGAVKSFKGLNVVKGIFTSLGNAVKKVMSKCGVDIGAFNKKIKGIKTHASSALNNIKGVFKIVFGAIGKAVKTASVIIAAVFGKKLSSTCSTSKAALTAFKAVAFAVFKGIKNTIGTVMAFVVPAVSGAFGAVAGFISSSVNTIAGVISGLMKVFDGITSFVTGIFTGNWQKAWQGVVDIFGGIFDTLSALIKAPINAVIGIINGAITGINKLGIKIPDWVPKIGGKKFGIDIPAIPMLYKGTNNWQGGAAVIHDRGGEIVDLPKGSRVYPHDKSIEMARREGAKGSITINIQKLADKIEVRSDEDIDRIAEVLAYKLKRIAFNTGTA